jgi:hypothetical protein
MNSHQFTELVFLVAGSFLKQLYKRDHVLKSNLEIGGTAYDLIMVQ